MSQVVAVRGLRVRIVYPAALAFPAMTVFRHLEVRRERAADILLEIVERGGRVHLFRNSDWIQSCSPDELATALKGQLLTEALEHGAYELALHAASLLSNDRMLLLCGNPGAGKTTLTLALVHAGFGFAADDVTLLDSRGRGIGLPFAPAVKAGAWPAPGRTLRPISMRRRSFAARTENVFATLYRMRSQSHRLLPGPSAGWSCSGEVATRKRASSRSTRPAHCAGFSMAHLRQAANWAAAPLTRWSRPSDRQRLIA